MFYSDASQDQFVANMFGFKQNGFYLDIGSCGAYGANNSAYFETLNWKGICVEINEHWNSSYNSRSCFYVNKNALELDYLKLLQETSAPQSIDYLSMDIDTLSLECLSKLPHDEYRFKIITIEHDHYLYGDEYREKQRDFLTKLNYKLICSDVLVPPNLIQRENCSFEDWWIDEQHFDNALIEKINSFNLYPHGIIQKFIK